MMIWNEIINDEWMNKSMDDDDDKYEWIWIYDMNDE